MSINKIYIINFDDSFTYNIASIIYPQYKHVEVIEYISFFDNNFNKVVSEIKLNKRIVIIFGPGPGHPNDYIKYFDQIKKLMNIENVLLVGICLGHQILLTILGYKVLKAQSQIHGERVLINYKNQNIFVQRYNSLAPKSKNSVNEQLLIGKDVYIYRDFNLIAFQFHPESIGTSNSELFLTEILGHVRGGNYK